jgi:hypothetical protein
LATTSVRRVSTDSHRLWRSELTLAGRAARAEGLLNDALDPDGFASFAVSATEGAIAQSELFRDVSHLKFVVATLQSMLGT